jgi:hypothetical protein
VAQLRQFGPIVTVSRAAEYVPTIELVRGELDADDVVLVTLFSPLVLIGLWCGPVRTARDGGWRALCRSRRAVSARRWVNGPAAVCREAGADGVYYSCWG